MVLTWREANPLGELEGDLLPIGGRQPGYSPASYYPTMYACKAIVACDEGPFVVGEIC